MQLQIYQNTDTQHIPRNPRQAFLYYLSKLDADMAALVLDDTRTYQDATKEVFVEKLSEVIRQFKLKGDTELRIVRGNCANEQCHKGCPGYAFVGNHSAVHLDLIIEGNNTEMLDIYYCGDFATEAAILSDTFVRIFIDRDEEADFIPDVQYLLEISKCNLAFQEILHTENNIIEPEMAISWLSKHRALYDSIDILLALSKQRSFSLLYENIQSLIEVYVCNPAARNALLQLEQIKKSDNKERQVLGWLVAQEELGRNILMGFVDVYFSTKKKVTEDLYRLNDRVDLLVDKRHFNNIIEFIEIFNQYYWPTFEKYRTISSEEMDNMEYESERYMEARRLSYHLSKRHIQYDV
jgi:hypothetical protein